MPRPINPDKPSRKRSGVSTEVAMRTQTDLKARVIAMIGHAKHFCLTNEDIIEKYEHIMRSPAATRAPEWVRFYIRGVYDTLRDMLYQYNLVWVFCVDGKLMLPKEVDDLTARENAEIKERAGPVADTYKSPLSRIDSYKSRHVWTDAKGAPRTDKPFQMRYMHPTLAMG